jgi:hypothetical protein
MKRNLLVVGLLIVASAGVDLLACGDKFLVTSRGTRFQRAAAARQPATILVYANPASSLPKALERAAVEETLRRAGYRPTSVTAAGELERALRQGGWDLVLADLNDIAALRASVKGGTAPMLVPVVYNPTATQLAQAKKEYQRVLKGPVKSQAFLEAIDDALALREKLLSKTA